VPRWAATSFDVRQICLARVGFQLRLGLAFGVEYEAGALEVTMLAGGADAGQRRN
jgi:hypothetical protein